MYDGHTTHNFFILFGFKGLRTQLVMFNCIVASLLSKNCRQSSPSAVPCHSSEKSALSSSKEESSSVPPKMNDNSTQKGIAKAEEASSLNIENQSNHAIAEGEELTSRETHNDNDDDDEDGDDAEDEDTEDGLTQGVVEISKTTSTLIQKKCKDKGLQKPKVTKKRKKRKMKPKDYPKRPLSAYNIFFKQTREKNLEENGKLSFQEMVKAVAAEWKEISPEQKAKYQDLASEDLARYKKAVGVYERDTLEKDRAEREDASRARRKIVAEEERKAKKAQKDVSSRRTAFPPSVPSANSADRGGWEVRAYPSGNPYLEKSMSLPVSDNAYASDRAAMNPNNHLDSVTGNGSGFADLTAARNRIHDELRSMEESRAIHLRCFELAQAAGISPAAAAAALQTSGRGGFMSGLDHRTPTELDLQQHQVRHLSAAGLTPLGGGADSVAAANEAEMRERMAMIRYPGVAAEHEARLLQEARLTALGHSGFSAGSASINPYSSLLGSLVTVNPYEEALMRDQLLRRQELLLRASMGPSSAGSLTGFPGSALHSALGGGFGSGLGALGGTQQFTDLGYPGSAGAGFTSLGTAYDTQARLGMGVAAEDRLTTLGRLSDVELLRSLSRQVRGNYPPPVGEGHSKRIDSP
jgi:hypothetical protein